MAKKHRKQHKKPTSKAPVLAPAQNVDPEEARLDAHHVFHTVEHPSGQALVQSGPVKTSPKAKAPPAAERSRIAADSVRKSTLYIAVGLALVAGVYLGTLLPGLTSVPQSTQSAPAAQTKQQDTAHLAEHILEMEERTRKNPNDVDAWIRLGNLYFDTGKAASSINAYERALLIKPDNPDVLTDLGIMYRETAKYDLAVESFRKASAVNPQHQNALFNRGIVLYFDLGRKEEARAAWQQLLSINPAALAPNGKPVKEMLSELL